MKKYFHILIFCFVSVLLPKSMAYSQTLKHSDASHFSPEITENCKKAGGVPRTFGCTATDSCEDFVLAQRAKAQGRGRLCGGAHTASCDCGPDKCFYQNKCWKNEEGAKAWKKEEIVIRSEVYISLSSYTSSNSEIGKITQTLESEKKSFKTCFVQALKDNKSSYEKISVTWLFAPGGKVKDISTYLYNPSDKDLGSCMIKKLQEIKFPEVPMDPTYKVTLIFSFAPVKEGEQ